jgi:hypothetical protein
MRLAGSSKVQFVPSSELKSGSHSGTETNRTDSTFWELELFAWCHSRDTAMRQEMVKKLTTTGQKSNILIISALQVRRRCEMKH